MSEGVGLILLGIAIFATLALGLVITSPTYQRAQGIEAATAGETACGLDGNRESPVANGDAPNPNPTTGG